MDLARIAVKLRPRTPWEGIDLGFMLARQWFLQLWILWMISALPVMLLLTLLPIPLWLMGVLLWWLKPLYEPPMLFWLGRRLFGDRPSWKELRSNWSKVVLPQLFANLTWRRLHPSRSFLMPVSVLERLKGKARSQRIQVLSRKSNAAGWLTIIGIHFEFIFEMGFISLIVMLVPEELLWIDWKEYLFEPGITTEWMQQVAALLAMSMVAPFYVAGGFALYLTRRSELEGWDIELGLRRMAQRSTGAVVSGFAAILLCGLLAWGGSVTPLQAAEVDRQQVRDAIAEILADKAFGYEQEKTRWEYDGDIPDNEPAEDNRFPQWMTEIAQGIASFGELLMWLAGGGLLAYLIYWFINNQDLNLRGLGASRNGRVVPTQIAGLDLRPESLPDDPAAEAERLIGLGDYRAALGLLYRGALSALVHRHTLEIPQGATEGECRQLVESHLGQPLDVTFSGLTRLWQRQAYGHTPPSKEEALSLCQEWRSCFGGAVVDA
ncbi:MAG: DUF4129 domain-containing protein [Candidatus Thiodiazotropha sp.]